MGLLKIKITNKRFIEKRRLMELAGSVAAARADHPFCFWNCKHLHATRGISVDGIKMQTIIIKSELSNPGQC